MELTRFDRVLDWICCLLEGFVCKLTSDLVSNLIISCLLLNSLWFSAGFGSAGRLRTTLDRLWLRLSLITSWIFNRLTLETASYCILGGLLVSRPYWSKGLLQLTVFDSNFCSTAPSIWKLMYYVNLILDFNNSVFSRKFMNVQQIKPNLPEPVTLWSWF